MLLTAAFINNIRYEIDMSELLLIARMTIQDGKLDQFKNVAEECMQIVREKDSGTTEYTWYLNEPQLSCVVTERFVDSNALMEHVDNLGDALGKLGALVETSVELFGEPTEELLKSMEDANPTIYRFLQRL